MEDNIYAISYKMRLELYRRIFSVAMTFFLCFLAVSLLLSFVIFPVTQKSVSMAPDIPCDSVELIVPFLRSPHRGDVVLVQSHELKKKSMAKRVVNTFFLFITARKWYPFEEKPRSSACPVMRRVIGVPGDTIYIDKYVVYIQPKGENHFLSEFEIVNKKYNVKIFTPPVEWDSDLGSKASTEKIVLGADEYYVMGDNRMECADSRIWGAIKHSAVTGKVFMLYYPFNKVKFF